MPAALANVSGETKVVDIPVGSYMKTYTKSFRGNKRI